MSAAELEVVQTLTRDLRNSSTTLSAHEARFLVDAYYMIQENRIRANNQIRALNEAGEPHAVIQWLFEQNQLIESQIKRALDAYSGADAVGRWARSIKGIGPVIAAGLLAHIDIERAPTAGHIWSFAGLDPRAKWEKGQKRPWNAALKTLCWKIGKSFIKVQNREGDFYGHLYKQRKLLEQDNNEAGQLKSQAESKLEACKIGKTTDAYKWYIQGMLPPAHIDARARRWAVKLFLAHYHEVAYFVTYKRLPPNPYPIAHLDHVHYIGVPNATLVPGLPEARRDHNQGAM